MTWRSCLLVMITASVFVATVRAAEPSRPNIVFILVDDLGWSDLHCYGHAYHRTPHLDRLATEGMRFIQAYAPAPICSASRASILTGKTPARLRFEFVTKNKAGRQQLDAEVPLRTPALTLNLPLSEATVAERLSRMGYLTAFFGKWHVSQHYQDKYLAWHPKYGPHQQGFAIGTEDFGDHPYAWKKKKAVENLPRGVFPTDSMIDRTCKFIRKRKDSAEPYFLMASSFYVHTPIRNRCRWLVDEYQRFLPADAPQRAKRLEYAAFVETLDHHVGSLLKAVEDSGQRDNTLVLLMSDNGGHPEYCSNAPLRGSKWNLYEGGIRVPMIARWPGRVPAGKICGTPIAGYDLLPTFVGAAGGLSDESSPDIDGIDVQRAFANPDWQPSRSLLWHFPYYHPESTYSKAVDRIGVSDFVVSKTRPQSALRQGNYKLLQFAEDGRRELYDLSTDESEQNDLSEQLPEVATRLSRLLETKLDRMNARRAVAAEKQPADVTQP